MTPEEAKKVLDAANLASDAEQWPEVVHLLQPLHEQQIKHHYERGDAAYLLGLANMHLGHWELASGLMTEASSTGGSLVRTNAKLVLDQIKHHYRAADAEVDGVNKRETSAVLRAADEALARNDFDLAFHDYWAVYDGQGTQSDRAWAASGIASVLIHRGDYAQAKEYAEYALHSHNHEVVAAARALLNYIKEQQGAATAIQDGTSAGELEAVSNAAASAFDGDDYDHAYRLFASVAVSEQLGSADRAKAAYNAGLCAHLLGHDQEARQHYEWVAAHGAPDLVKDARERIGELDRQEAADRLVAGLAR